jgi:membrane-bound lytic murein transglycosylase F
MNTHFLHSKKTFRLCIAFSLILITVLAVLNAHKTTLEKIQARNTLIVLTRNAPTTYYEGLDGETGLEYDLCLLFAEYLGVELAIELPRNFSDIIPMVNGHQADLAAAGLTVTEPRKKLVRFGPAYQDIRQQLIYSSTKNKRPQTIADIIGGRLEIVTGSSFEERLNELKIEYPELTWLAHEDSDNEQLLEMVATGDIDYTIIDSNEFEHHRRFYPELRVAFDISTPQQLAWAFRNDSVDDGLYRAAERFFEKISHDGTLTRLLEKHYGYVRQFEPVETTEFLRHVENRLPEYKSLFEEAGREYGFDWRLLAAASYQESYWIPTAVSPTGVRGLMMLTDRTAGQLGVRNRLDARDSIMGGARYLKMLKENLPDDIQEPDRTWMALAAYNVGSGHLEDARVITEAQGKNPDRWADVIQFLPMLSKRAWYTKTKYGYARGREPVIYVTNIRSYYDILSWLDERESGGAPKSTAPGTIVPQSL